MKVDLHSHTYYSYDSSASPREMVDAAIKKGMSCLAICDHGEIKGAIEAMEAAIGKPILIIPGIEVKSKAGDILGLNVREKIPNKLSAKETIKRIKEAGGLAIIPHPFGWFCSFGEDLEGLVSEVDEAMLHLHLRSASPRSVIDGIEIFNASLFGGNEKALAFARKHQIPFTAGSDAHFPNFIGRAFLEIPGENLSIEEIFSKIKNREVEIFGREATFLEKIADHGKRNLVKLFKVAP